MSALNLDKQVYRIQPGSGGIQCKVCNDGFTFTAQKARIQCHEKTNKHRTALSAYLEELCLHPAEEAVDAGAISRTGTDYLVNEFIFNNPPSPPPSFPEVSLEFDTDAEAEALRDLGQLLKDFMDNDDPFWDGSDTDFGAQTRPNSPEPSDEDVDLDSFNFAAADGQRHRKRAARAPTSKLQLTKVLTTPARDRVFRSALGRIVSSIKAGYRRDLITSIPVYNKDGSTSSPGCTLAELVLKLDRRYFAAEKTDAAHHAALVHKALLESLRIAKGCESDDEPEADEWSPVGSDEENSPDNLAEVGSKRKHARTSSRKTFWGIVDAEMKKIIDKYGERQANGKMKLSGPAFKTYSDQVLAFDQNGFREQITDVWVYNGEPNCIRLGDQMGAGMSSMNAAPDSGMGTDGGNGTNLQAFA
ncbi:hypothetical protein C8J56DRAFT_894298 [Mycena floridula]|nr:hypothetical protein C8J56DRAFT_894298 [Mycena floridula]